MNFVTIGLLVSSIVLCLLIILFRYEARRGERVGERARTYADFFILKTVHTLHGYSRFFGKDFLQQRFYFIFHTILRLFLKVTKRSEAWVRTTMRTNKNLAKTAERESVTRTKLEEIALHKLESALTPKQKRAHLEKTLNGD